MTIHLNTAAKIGVGIGITGMAVRYLGVSNPVTVLGLTVMGQTLAWMPDFVNRCLHSLKRPSTPPSLSSLPHELLSQIGAELEHRDHTALRLADKKNYEAYAYDRFGRAVVRFESKDELTIQEIRDLKADFSRKNKQFKLDLSNSNITDDELEDIVSRFPGIIEINAANCRGLTDRALQSLARLSNLEKLNLERGHYQITDTGLQNLVSLRNLKSLNLAECHRITDVGLHYLACLTNLEKLDLTWCQITDTGLQDLADLPISSLNLTGCHQITDAGLKKLVSLRNLRNHLTTLTLSSCEITDAGLKNLVYLTHLTTLNLAECPQITDTGLQPLAYLTHLRSLNLAGCNLTDDGLQLLSYLTHLRSLNLARCFDITDAGCVSLKAHLANLIITL